MVKATRTVIETFFEGVRNTWNQEQGFDEQEVEKNADAGVAESGSEVRAATETEGIN